MFEEDLVVDGSVDLEGGESSLALKFGWAFLIFEGTREKIEVPKLRSLAPSVGCP